MKKILLLITTIVCCNCIYAQNKIDSINILYDSLTSLYQSVQIQSEFVGGTEAWKNFLMKNLNVDGIRDKLPRKLTRKPLRQSVDLKFTVCKDGSLCDFSIANDSAVVHPAFKEEALRVIKLSPNWLPGYQNGTAVKSIKKQRIIFVID